MATLAELEAGQFFITEEGNFIPGTQTRAGKIIKLPTGAEEPWEVKAFWIDEKQVRRETPEVVYENQIKSVTVVIEEDAWASAQKL